MEKTNMNEEKEVQKNKSKAPIIITILLLLIIAIGLAVGGFFIWQNNKSTGSNWGDTYYAYLKSAVDKNSKKEEYGLKDGMENIKLQFIEKENTTPIMVMSYKYGEKDYINLYKMTGENKVDKVIYEEPATVEFLYNLETQTYDWYVHQEKENEDYYKKVYSLFEQTEQENADYVIKKDDIVQEELVEGGTIELPRYDLIFTEAEIEETPKIDFNFDMKISDLKDKITQTVQNYKAIGKLITEEIKNKMESRVKEIESIKQVIKELEEENKNKDKDDKEDEEEQDKTEDKKENNTTTSSKTDSNKTQTSNKTNANNVSSSLDELEIISFNSKFDAYIGKKSGAIVKALIQEVINSNLSSKEHQITIKYKDKDGKTSSYTSKDELTNLRAKTIRTKDSYSISTSKDSKGYIKTITINY